jgi:hypothetical protein
MEVLEIKFLTIVLLINEMNNLNTYSNICQNTFKHQEKFWILFITCMKFWKSKISIMSLINDLGINKVPKENKN